MMVEFRCDVARPRAWMDQRVMMIGGKAADVQLAWVTTKTPKPSGLEMLLQLERMLLRKGKPCDSDALKIASGQQQPTGRAPDAVVDFTDAERDANCGAPLYLRVRYNGIAGEDGALSAILAGDLPVIEIVDEVSGAILDRGQPSSECATGLSGALATVIARKLTLLEAVLSGRPRLLPQLAYVSSGNAPRAPAAYVLNAITECIAKRIYHLCCFSPHWQVGWRHVDGDGVWQRGDLSGPRWQIISDPGSRCYADPFPVTWQGRTFVFFEDLDHRTGKGIISALEFDASGPKGEVVRVLEEPWHLSYPLLIEDNGELWMIPESSSNNDVAIYKCIEFPTRWERHATLLSDVWFSDATPVRHNGLYYLFGVSRDGRGGYSDTLSIYYATHLLGPWQPHANNPILIDRASARPAGHFVTLNGQLWRPVQDCTNGYGTALGLAQIVELSPTSYKQVVQRTIRPGPAWPGRKLHTLNRSGRLEVIDGSRIQPKLATLFS